jgi:hypothetical protein
LQLKVTYVGAAGRKLMRQDRYYQPNPNFTGKFDLMAKEGDSSYQALQAQFHHRVAHGLQTLFSYTWPHSNRRCFLRPISKRVAASLPKRGAWMTAFPPESAQSLD